MASKDDILEAIRRRQGAESALPELNGEWIRYADPLAQFQTMVESVGGNVVRVCSALDIAGHLAANPKFASATRVVSQVAEVASTLDLATVDDPHDLEAVDWAVLPAQFGVAENGAVWVTDERLRHRAIYFIVQHLALVLPAGEIVHNMHEAYGRITVGGSSLGLFMSGPSKTADIEQSLVIGAHGPRSLTLFLTNA